MVLWRFIILILMTGLKRRAARSSGQPGLIETIAQNVGSVEAYGIEFTGNWKPASFNDYAYFTMNLTHNIATFQNEIISGGGAPIGILGNQLSDSPKWLATAGITVEPTEWIVANLSARYTGMRYADFHQHKRDGIIHCC